MDVSREPRSQVPTATFLDRLGGRFVVRDRTGVSVEILVFPNELVSPPGFEAALRETVSKLTDFHHPSARRVRGLARLAEPDNRLALVSDLLPGSRLSEVLYAAEQDRRPVGTPAAMFVLREVLAATVALHEAAPGIIHGAIGPERILLTFDGRVLLVEYALGAALECHASLSSERLWKEYRLPVPDGPSPRFGPRTEVIQIGLVALSLLLGRLLRRDEFPRRISELLLTVGESGPDGSRSPLGLGLRAWLLRTLQISSQDSYATVEQARAQFEHLLSSESSYVAKPDDILTLLRAAVPLPPPQVPSRPTDGPQEDAGRPESEPAADAGVRPEKPRADKGAAAEQPAARAVPPAVASPRSEMAPVTPEPELAAAVTVAPTVTVATALMADHDHGPRSEPGQTARRPAASHPGAVSEPAATDREPLSSAPHESARPLRTEDLELPPGVGCVAEDVHSTVAPGAGRPKGTAAHAAPRSRGTSSLAGDTASHTSFADRSLFGAPEAGVEPRRTWLTRRRLMISAGALVLIVVAVVLGLRLTPSRAAAGPESGTLKVDSRPPGAEVFVDGKARGRTPLSVNLAVGPHRLEVGNGQNPQVIPVTIAAGAEVRQYVELPVAPERGELRVVSEPPGARVIVDGTPRGVAPVTVTDLTPGEHSVALEGQNGTVKQSVTVVSGATASLVVPLAGAPAVAQGWIAVTAPVPMQLFENGRLLGTSQGDAVAVPAGRHVIELVNTAVGYRETKSVDVTAGKMSPVAIEMPTATLSLNAIPWAEVFVDGRKVGDTPLGNLTLPAGPHEVVFRHPQFGEQRQTVIVTLPGPTLLSVDLRK